MPYVLLGARWVLATVFFVAGLAKLLDLPALVAAINRYGLLPIRLTRPLAAALPLVELVLAVALAAGAVPVVAGWAAFSVLTMFNAAILINLVRGRRFDCGCGVREDRVIGWGLVAQNAILMAAGAAIAVGPASALSVMHGWGPLARHTLPSRDLIAIPMTVIALTLVARVIALGDSRAGVHAVLAHLRVRTADRRGA